MSESVIMFRGVSILQGEKEILKDVNFEMKKGDFVYLIGKTGMGKSSFIKTLNGEIPLKVGEGAIVGFDLKRLKSNDIPMLRRQIGVVFQDFKLLSDRSVYDNLKFVLQATGWKDKKAIQEKSEAVLNSVGMSNIGNKYPHELSGGEQQRVAIARALLNDPELILADEPTGNLDPQTSFEVMEVLRDLNKKGQTFLMATHDYAILSRYPSRTLKCDNHSVFEVVQRQS
ncbi:MAG: ATP-binding cassette domain-containing protein [Bacteroidetes bacterium]|jgi:cell division transport system ATP-binding protein|nr:ATP-binding cassette domain-containing protein [Bacteroidota bacterium]MDA0880055.1 ATP-binding cassette domain-containing protein [Bacteroidota bacterium]MDA1115963.1 ATP-binding cassette domain-containing protein [Bacteroidota bacterium]